MLDNIGLFAGSFDPITNAHLELIDKAIPLFDKLYVGVFVNLSKKGLFSKATRIRLLREALLKYPNVEVISFSNRLVVDIAKEYGVTHLVRGIRNATDLEYEAGLNFFNSNLNSSLETIYFLSSSKNRFISSSAVRELIHYGQDIREYVPKSVQEEVRKKYGIQ